MTVRVWCGRVASHDRIPSRPIIAVLDTTLLLTCSDVFMPFAVLSMKQPLKLDYVWAAMCISAAVFFVFRES